MIYDLKTKYFHFSQTNVEEIDRNKTEKQMINFMSNVIIRKSCQNLIVKKYFLKIKYKKV